MTEQFPVIPEINSGQALNLFQDLISGRLENKPSPQPSRIGEEVSCHSEAQGAERIQLIIADGGQEVRRSSNLAGKKIRRYEGKLFTLKSLSSNPPTLLSSNNHSGGNTSLIPTYGLRTSIKRNAAFTLAEVLITLGIIGVVAAMTMPSLIARYQEKELAVKARKAFSVVENAIKLAQTQNGVIGDNSFLFDPSKTSVQVAQNFSKYFNGAMVCPDKNTPECSKYFVASTKYAISGYVSTFNGQFPLIILPDGVSLAIEQKNSCTQLLFVCDKTDPATGNCATDQDGNSIGQIEEFHFCATVNIDVNGPKAPNQFGRDVYSARIQENGKITFTNWGQAGSASAKNIVQGIDKLEFKDF